MRNQKIFASALLLVLSLCSCGNKIPSRCNVDILGPDITTVFIPLKESHFVLFKLSGDATITKEDGDHGYAYYEKTAEILKLYDDGDFSFSMSGVYMHNPLFDSFIEHFSDCDTYLAFAINRQEKTYYEFCPFDFEHYRAIPIYNNKICLNKLYNFYYENREYFGLDPNYNYGIKAGILGTNYIARLEYLFVDGEDVYEDFPKTLKNYYQNYQKLVDELRSRNCE